MDVSLQAATSVEELRDAPAAVQTKGECMLP